MLNSLVVASVLDSNALAQLKKITSTLKGE